MRLGHLAAVIVLVAFPFVATAQQSGAPKAPNETQNKAPKPTTAAAQQVVVVGEPALETALSVLAANGVVTMVDAARGYTPTPVISHAIVSHNRGRDHGLADGVVVTPSHNPPADGGFKYNPSHGGNRSYPVMTR